MVGLWTSKPRRWIGSVSNWVTQAGVFGRARRRRRRAGARSVWISPERLEDRVLLSAISETEPNNTAAAAQVITMPTASILTATDNDKLIIDGNLTTSDTDYFQFSLGITSGVFFDIDSRDNGLSSTLDSVLTVYNSGGVTVLGSNDDGYDFEGFAMPATSTADGTSPDSSLYLDLIPGTYLVRVSSNASTTGAYQLKLLADSGYSSAPPTLNSNTTAADTLFLDFDGHGGTDSWGTYSATAFDFNSSPAQFSPAEQLAIKNAWRTASEDFSPFALNVTTVAPAAFADGLAFRMVITNSDSTIIGQPTGNLGNSFTGSYTTNGAGDNVGFVFAENFPLFNTGGASGRMMARAAEQGNTIAHEFGHPLGLSHYQSQAGGGIGSVIPNAIMANPDIGLNREIWRTGTNESGNAQDDMAVISNLTNTLGYRTDDHGNAQSTATVITIANGSGSVNGIIANVTGDSDYFQFTASGTTTVTANVDEYVNDLDTVLNVYNFNGGLLASSNPTNSFDSSVTVSLAAGTYFAEVKSHGSAGEAGQYTIRVETSTAPTLSINDVSVTEGNSGTVNATFTVSLNKPSDQTVVVSYATADGSAVSPTDFVAVPLTPITFAPGVTSRTISVIVNSDLTHEATETFVVNLSNPINVTVSDTQGIGTIVNDDSAPTIAINDISVTEGNSGTANATFTVLLSTASSQTITVQYATANGTAAAPLDYSSVLPTTLTFNPGTTSKTITVYVNGDVITENNETFAVNLSNPTIASIADSQGIATIIDDDQVPPTISINDVTVVEGDSGTVDATFTVTLSAASNQAISVNFATADGSAMAPTDYTTVPTTTLAFAAGVTSRTITIAVVGELVHELTENFFVNLSSAVNATISDNQGIGTITNNDVVPQISIDDVSVTEGNAGTANATFTVVLTRPSSQVITVQYATADGTAKIPLDYTAIASTVLTFAAGVTSRTITVQVNGDVVVENNETFFVNLTNPTIATIADSQGIGTIIDDDQVPPTISINDVTVTEADSGTPNANFTVTLSQSSVQTVTVQYRTANGTATAPADYTSAALTTITFAPGVVTQTVAIPIVGDTMDEFDETYFVDLSNAVNATIFDNQGLGTILDNDATPAISINDVTVVEGNAGTSNATFTIALSVPSAKQITVNYATANGTAVQPQDYNPISISTLTFAAGVTSRTVTVQVNGDTLVENDETFTLNLSAPTNATIADDQGVGTIVNDDVVLPTITINDINVTEGNSGTTNATFTVTLSAASTQAVTVRYSTQDGTATAPADFTAAANQTLTFNPGETSKPLTILVAGETLPELNETFFVDLSNAIGATISDNQGQATIVNDDSPPTISVDDISVTEGNSGTANATFTIALSGPSALPITVQYVSAEGTAKSSSPLDFYAVALSTLSFAPGVTSRTVTVSVAGDVLVESNETFFLNLSNATNATIADPQGVATIVDDDVVLPSLTINDISVTEGNLGTTNATFTVTLSQSSTQAVTVRYATQDGTATSPADYAAVANQTLTFSPGEVSKPLTIQVAAETIHELNENFFVNLSNAIGATIGDTQGIATILNDDAPPTISINDVSVTEGNAGTANATFTVSLSGPSSQQITVQYASADGTAKSTTPLDFYAVAATVLTFAPGVTSRSISVQTQGDVLVESNETFFVNLSNPTIASIADGQGIGTIIDDDAVLPTITIGDITVTEGNTGTTAATFTVTLSAPSTQAVTVRYSTQNGTALAASDYIAVSNQTLTIAPGQTTGTFTIDVVNDTINEVTESFFVNLANAINATISDTQAECTIANDDPIPSISINDVSVSEGNAGTSNATFTVSLSSASAIQISVQYATANVTAIAPLDYSTVPLSVLTFAPGVTSRTVTVQVNGDTLFEQNETFVVNLSLPVNATIADNQGQGTILNDDSNIPSITINDVTLTEGNLGTTNATFTVTLSSPQTSAVTVQYATADGSAKSPADYTAIPVTTLAFPIGTTTQQVTVAVQGDIIDENNHTYFINLTNAVGATIADTQGIGTIVDDDAAPTMTINDVTLTEGNSGTSNATFTVTLSVASELPITVQYSTQNGTAVSGLDYDSITPTTLTFSPGVTTRTITVQVKGETLSEVDETFFVNLANPVNATISDTQGRGTIVNDDAVLPTLTINDISVVEGNAGTTNATFTITLATASTQTVTVLYSTQNNTARAPSDFTAATNAVATFSPGVTSQTVTILVVGDTVVEAAETFFVNLTGPVNATILDSQGQGTILNDDSVSPERFQPERLAYGGGVHEERGARGEDTTIGTRSRPSNSSFLDPRPSSFLLAASHSLSEPVVSDVARSKAVAPINLSSLSCEMSVRPDRLLESELRTIVADQPASAERHLPTIRRSVGISAEQRVTDSFWQTLGAADERFWDDM